MPSRLHSDRTVIRRLTTAAVLTALGVVLLYIGGFLDVLDITMAAVSGIVMLVSVIENTRGWTWAQYVGTCILALALMPFNFAGWSYLLLYGFYPIVKNILDMHIHVRSLRILIKMLICVVSGSSMYLILRFLLDSEDATQPIYILVGVLYLIVFWIYDLLLTRLTLIYTFKFQKKLHLNLK